MPSFVKLRETSAKYMHQRFGDDANHLEWTTI